VRLKRALPRVPHSIHSEWYPKETMMHMARIRIGAFYKSGNDTGVALQ